MTAARTAVTVRFNLEEKWHLCQVLPSLESGIVSIDLVL